MVLQRSTVDCGIMCIDNKSHRPGFPSIKFRLREERKKVISISSTKYYNIEDHETGMRRFCLIRNTLGRLQHEAREDKLARHKAKHLYDHPTPSPISALSDDEDELPPCKRPRLFMDDDKENEKEKACEDQLIDVIGDKDVSCSIDAAQEILREMYERYTGERLSQFNMSSPALYTQSDKPYNNILGCKSTNLNSNSSSLSDSNSIIDLSYKSNLNSSSYINIGECSCVSMRKDWLRPHEQCICGNSTLMRNDLNSVVYHSLITSL